jgi:hypothetical protein
VLRALVAVRSFLSRHVNELRTNRCRQRLGDAAVSFGRLRPAVPDLGRSA